MAKNWGDVTWNEYGELVVDIYKHPPEAKDDTKNNPKHTYKEIDCGGECGGFSIHGGWDPGSAGCIDLTEQMDGFAKWFKNNGKDLMLYVAY